MFICGSCVVLCIHLHTEWFWGHMDSACIHTHPHKFPWVFSWLFVWMCASIYLWFLSALVPPTSLSILSACGKNNPEKLLTMIRTSNTQTRAQLNKTVFKGVFQCRFALGPRFLGGGRIGKNNPENKMWCMLILALISFSIEDISIVLSCMVALPATRIWRIAFPDYFCHRWSKNVGIIS